MPGVSTTRTISCSLVSVIICAACSTIIQPPDGLVFEALNDPSGCVVERVIAETDSNHYQYDSFSHDGQSIAIGWDRGEDARGTFLLSLVTGDRTPIPELNNGATISPDGKYFLNSIYVENGKTDIVQIERQTGVSQILAPHDEWDWLPSYSTDGKRIVFNSYRTGRSDVYVMDIATETLRQLTHTDLYEAHAQFSPDDNKVMYHQRVAEANFNIRTYDLNTNQDIQLTDEPTEESYASWSPDGQYIVFASDRDQQPGITDLFIMTQAGEVLRKLTNTPTKDAYPFWSPDGEFVYFTSYRSPQGVYRIPVAKMINCKRNS